MIKISSIIFHKNFSFSKVSYQCFSNVKGLENNSDIINNHTRINSELERWKLILENSYKAITNPHDGTSLSNLGDLTSYSALIKIKEKMMKDETGRRILEEKPRFRSDFNQEELLKLSPNTFGFQYVNWMKQHGFSHEERPLVKYIPDFELAYIYQRYKEIHDFLHVLLYYDISIHNELVIKWFEMIQLGIPSCTLSALFGQILLSSSQRKDLYCNHLGSVIENAYNCKFLMNIYFEKELETDLVKTYPYKKVPLLKIGGSKTKA